MDSHQHSWDGMKCFFFLMKYVTWSFHERVKRWHLSYLHRYTNITDVTLWDIYEVSNSHLSFQEIDLMYMFLVGNLIGCAFACLFDLTTMKLHFNTTSIIYEAHIPTKWINLMPSMKQVTSCYQLHHINSYIWVVHSPASIFSPLWN